MSTHLWFRASLYAIALVGGLIPIAASPTSPVLTADVPSIKTTDRAAVLRLYHDFYRASVGIPSGFTGNVSMGDAGTVSPAYQQAVLRRVNYFRVMAGLPGNVVFDPALSAKAQQAALMMAANHAVNHFPPRTWRFYTAAGAEAASHAVLTLGVAGPMAVDDCIREPGDGNKLVGHRRWLLYPPQKTMGGGSVDEPGPGGKLAAGLATANQAGAIWTGGPFKYRPPVPERFVAWPPPGYVPAPLVFPRWSVSYPDADFSSAKVRVLKHGQEIVTALETPKPGAAGDNTLVWTLPSNEVSASTDQTYQVTVSHVEIAHAPHQFVYEVTSATPDRTDFR